MPFQIFIAWLIIISGAFSSADVIRDIQILKQDHTYFLDKEKAADAMISPDEQKKMDASYNSTHFSPWHREKPLYEKNKIEEELKIYRLNPGYGENRRQHSVEWIEEIAANIVLDAYPNAGSRGIVLANTDLRVLPTHKPHFHHCEAGPCTYPFDNFQQSAIYVNTPIFISHMTKDKAWVFVEAGYTYGWLPARDVAYVDEAFVRRWESGRYLVPVKDKTNVYGEDGRYLFNVPIGSMFPEVGQDTKNRKILVAVADNNARGMIKQAVIPKEAVALKPLALNRQNMAGVANELINEPYGWGGLYRNRDCSAMIRDLFAPFGIWMPRNSRKQALEGGNFIDLKKMSAEEKEKIIREEGIPYMTLLWRKGHIMLYMGSYNGDLLVFHNFWSARAKEDGSVKVKVKSKGKRKGKNKVITVKIRGEKRTVVGHAAITTLHPGVPAKQGRQARDQQMQGIIGMTVITNKTK